MSRKCAWCGNNIVGDSQPESVGNHNICDACTTGFSQELRQPIEKFLNTIDVPVMVVDSRNLVVSANDTAKKRLGIAPGGPALLPFGEVIECIYSTDQDSCGQLVHCNGCTIRNSVMETSETGNSLENIPAFLDLSGPDGLIRSWFRISTRKAADKVLLKIEPAEEPADTGQSG